jgi:beta-galactosidase
MNKDLPWAEKGHLVAAAQFILPWKSKSESIAVEQTDLTISEDHTFIDVTGIDFWLSIDAETGNIERYEYKNITLISGELKPNFWRAQTDNDRRGWKSHEKLKYWITAAESLDNVEITWEENQGKYIEIKVLRDLPDKKGRFNNIYKVYSNGWINVMTVFEPSGELPNLPRLGLQGKISSALDNITYLGKGPHENYQDRQISADVGLYSTGLDSFSDSYIYPQEYGNRLGVRWIAFLDEREHGVVIAGDQPLSMSAWPWSQQNLEVAKHTFDLTRDGNITVNIDLIQMGVGGNDTWSDDSAPMEKYQIKAERMTYSFWIKPFVNEIKSLGEFARMKINK